MLVLGRKVEEKIETPPVSCRRYRGKSRSLFLPSNSIQRSFQSFRVWKFICSIYTVIFLSVVQSLNLFFLLTVISLHQGFSFLSTHDLQACPDLLYCMYRSPSWPSFWILSSICHFESSGFLFPATYTWWLVAVWVGRTWNECWHSLHLLCSNAVPSMPSLLMPRLPTTMFKGDLKVIWSRIVNLQNLLVNSGFEGDVAADWNLQGVAIEFPMLEQVLTLAFKQDTSETLPRLMSMVQRLPSILSQQCRGKFTQSASGSRITEWVEPFPTGPASLPILIPEGD